jgi:osmoprotectant transport system permease protein
MAAAAEGGVARLAAILPAAGARWTGRNVVLLLLAVGLAGALGLAFVGASPNRILSPKPLSLFAAARPSLVGLLGVGLALFVVGVAARERRLAGLAVLAGAAIIFVGVFATAGDAATMLVKAAASPGARVSLGAGFWVIVITSALAIAEAMNRLGIPVVFRFLAALLVVAMVAALAAAGWFDDLSIVREWANRRDEYAAALTEHIQLVAAALVVALLIGVPLGVLTTARRRLARRTFAILSLIQTIPSIALFGLLIGPLTMLSEAVPGLRDIGVRGIGFTPALIALVLYSLLPIARNTEVGFLGVPPAVVDAARGMGMTGFQVMTRVSIPLALPVLLAGLRIVTVQLVGLAVVAALIGAGGLGSFVFLGLGQTATDLVLLGAISAILLALVADAALRLLALAVTPVRRS